MPGWCRPKLKTDASAPPEGQSSDAVDSLIPDARPGWETAILLPVPAAEPAVSRHRARFDQAARDGVPAHITVLYPFLPPAGISDQLLASLGRLFAGFAAFDAAVMTSR
jgi:hypothetical protein